MHRLREVMSLYGVSRYEAPPTGANAELEDVRLATHTSSIGQDTESPSENVRCWLKALRDAV